MEKLIRLYTEPTESLKNELGIYTRAFCDYLISCGKSGVLMVYEEGEPIAEIWISKVFSNALHWLVCDFIDLVETDPDLYEDLAAGGFQAVVQESDQWVRGLVFKLPPSVDEFKSWFGSHCQWIYVTSGSEIYSHNTQLTHGCKETESEKIFAYVCAECGAVKGDFHSPLCTSERCPFCGGFIAKCLCFYRRQRPGRGCEKVSDGSWALMPNFRIPVGFTKKPTGLDV